MTKEDKIYNLVSAGLFLIPIAFKYYNPPFISNYYNKRDLQNSPTANANQIYNVAPASVIRQANRFNRDFLEPLINYIGFRPSVGSWYRSQELNNYLYHIEPNEPDKYTEHMEGYTVDLYHSRIRDVVRGILELDLPFNQLILEEGTPYSPDWIHVSSKPANNAMEILVFDGSNYSRLSMADLVALYY